MSLFLMLHIHDSVRQSSDEISLMPQLHVKTSAMRYQIPGYDSAVIYIIICINGVLREELRFPDYEMLWYFCTTLIKGDQISLFEAA